MFLKKFNKLFKNSLATTLVILFLMKTLYKVDIFFQSLSKKYELHKKF